MDRRRLLQGAPPLLSSALIASSFPSLWGPSAAARAAKPRLAAALLLPQTGQYAALGRSMERAAVLAQAGSDLGTHRGVDRDGAIKVYDTGGSPEGAAAAARAARKAGASIILGPVFAREVPAVLGVVGREVPVLTFSNDAALIESGAFLLGLTARQSVAAIMGYAARRGVRKMALAGSGSGEGWGAQARAAAIALAPAIGVELNPASLPSTGASPEALPDAVLAFDVPTLATMTAQFGAQGVQPLGAFQGLDLAAEMVTRIDGAWIAAPDPADFAPFARAYEQRNGSPPGTIAALAYDAAHIAGQLLRGGGTDRSALLASGFKAICGDIRFHEDGSAARTLAILEAKQGMLRTVTTWPA